ncbi:hypothetical protein HPMG_00701 [Helicobacter pullorum MIT 98-5489]|uniref:Uncharacterized protein n=1 Tax=Helicobacter pullorum MIT 98-5489 TaxID=537972 RepID=C5EZC9_9HELI|nr:hypothetical protein HPMG_00701 [Helicobacter pullorum MIT 98-5489]
MQNHIKGSKKGHFKQNILKSYSKKRQNRFMRFLL